MSSLPTRDIVIGHSTVTSVGSADESLRIYSGNIDIGGHASVQFGDNVRVHHHYYGTLPQTTNLDSEKYDKLLNSLTFDRMDARLRNVATALPDTCTWIFHHEKFITWNDEGKQSQHTGVLWIKGKPGCGKSTIMKTALNWTRKNWPEHWVIGSYFFNARAPSAFEKSSLGFYQSVTHQLLSALPGFRHSFQRSFSSKIRADLIEAWSASELQEFLIDIIESPGRPSICLFIDALDEGDEDDVRPMIEFLEDISSRAASSNQPFRLCLSSRHYPRITISQALYLTVEDELDHDRDIEIYVDKKLRVVNQGMGDLRERLIQKSGKIFLWMTVVIPMLNKAYDRGGGQRAMSRLLEEIPEGLNSLFSDILSKKTDCFDECVVLLRWVLFSMHPLNLKELYLAILYTRYTDLDEDFRGKQEAVFDASHIQRCILHWSRGLVEVVDSGKGYGDPIVQFIHETVRDYMLFSKEAFQIVPELSADAQGASHEMMKNACVRYLASEQLEGQLVYGMSHFRAEVDFPFALYSASYTFHHADKAQQHCVPQRSFLLSQMDQEPSRVKTGPLEWNRMFNHVRYPELDKTLLYFAAEQNLRHLVQILVKESVDIHAKDNFYGRTPLEIACEKGFEEVAVCLIECGAYDDVHGTVKDETFRAACSGGSLEIVRLLLDRGANMSERGIGGPSLYSACENGHLAVAKLLLERGADANALGGFFGNALQVACRKGDLTVVELLLDKGADTNACDGFNDNALYTASRHGFPQIVELLLDRQADIDAQGGSLGTALSTAVEVERDDIMRLLINRGADVKAQNFDGMSALCVAARNGRCDHVQLLFDAGAAGLPDTTRDEVEIRRALEFARAGLAGTGTSWRFPQINFPSTIKLLEQQLAARGSADGSDDGEVE